MQNRTHRNRNKTNRTMKPKFKLEQIYLDLSKLSEEQQRKISVLINGVLNLNSDRLMLSFNPYNLKWELYKYLYKDRKSVV